MQFDWHSEATQLLQAPVLIDLFTVLLMQPVAQALNGVIQLFMLASLHYFLTHYSACCLTQSLIRQLCIYSFMPSITHFVKPTQPPLFTSLSFSHFFNHALCSFIIRFPHILVSHPAACLGFDSLTRSSICLRATLHKLLIPKDASKLKDAYDCMLYISHCQHAYLCNRNT